MPYATPTASPRTGYHEACERLMSAIAAPQRPAVAAVLADPRRGGRGLRAWLRAEAVTPRPLPACVPPEVIDVYLRDAEAEPRHDCGGCGLPLPVRPSGRGGHDAVPERVYFTHCPNCGGAAGPHAYWRHRGGSAN